MFGRRVMWLGIIMRMVVCIGKLVISKTSYTARFQGGMRTDKNTGKIIITKTNAMASASSGTRADRKIGKRITTKANYMGCVGGGIIMGKKNGISTFIMGSFTAEVRVGIRMDICAMSNTTSMAKRYP